MGEDAKAAVRLKGSADLPKDRNRRAEEPDKASVPAPPASGRESPRPAPEEFVEAARWHDLAEEILAAREVEIYGIVPGPLLEAMRALLESRESLVGALPPIAYYTATPQSVLRTYNEGIRTRLAYRWQVGFMGLRNVIDAAGRVEPSSGEDEPAVEALFTMSSSFSGCIVLIKKVGGGEEIRYFSVLPMHPDASERGRILELDVASSRDKLRRYLSRVAADAKQLKLREVFCEPEQAGMHPPTTDLRMAGLAPYGGGRTKGSRRLKPVAILALRYRRAEGDQVLLKRRTELTDNDNFDKLSLLSARVQEADIASALGVGISDHEQDADAYDHLWVRSGELDPFPLPQEAFRLAARRELFVTCGLQLPDDRLEFDGLFVLDEHESAGQLGFAVFHVNLQRSCPDEASTALGRNPQALEAVPLADLYSEERSGELNRLLLFGKDWLTERTLAPTRSPASGSA